MWCDIWFCCVVLCMSCHVMSCHVMSCHVMSCYVLLCYVMYCYVMLCDVMLYYIMLCYVMLIIRPSVQLDLTSIPLWKERLEFSALTITFRALTHLIISDQRLITGTLTNSLSQPLTAMSATLRPGGPLITAHFQWTCRAIYRNKTRVN